MARYRKSLPQFENGLFITDGGIETTLIFRQGIPLPDFCAFVLLDNEEGLKTLERYFREYLAIARRHQVGIILDSPTCFASPERGKRIGYSDKGLERVNLKAIEMLAEIRDSVEPSKTRVVISGGMGPRGDGYVPSRLMSVEEAARYHSPQIETFARTEADLVTAYTLNYPEEAAGIALAARSADMPVVISFTVETDGRLPAGDTLKSAIERTDELSEGYPAYYMINCAHPAHFTPSLRQGGGWLARIRGIRPNASKKSHAELDGCATLDDGDPAELAQQLRNLRAVLPDLNVVGGCCGTDTRHVEEICRAVIA